jgi:hypothetical protein
MKLQNVEDELHAVEKLMPLLQVELHERKKFSLPKTSAGRSLLVFRKTGNTPAEFPRSAKVLEKKSVQRKTLPKSNSI